MELRNVGKAISESDLIEIEQKMNLLLPIEFKEFYLQHNGGNPVVNTYYRWNEEEKTRINSFDRIKKDNGIGLEVMYENLIVKESYLPLGIIPFANDDSGNMFCLSARESDFGSVYYCNNDDYDIDNKEECLTLLDKGFKRFIDNLV